MPGWIKGPWLRLSTRPHYLGGIRILGEAENGRSGLVTISVEYNPGELKVSKGREEVYVKNCAISCLLG